MGRKEGAIWEELIFKNNQNMLYEILTELIKNCQELENGYIELLKAE